MDIQKIWNDFNKVKSPKKPPVNNIRKSIYNNIELADNEVFQNTYDIVMEYQAPRNDPFYRPNIIESLTNIGTLVRKIHDIIYPLKIDTYPKELIQGVQKTYEQIRIARYNSKKTTIKDDKFGMKGLKSPVVVAVILYCTFIFDNIPIPAPMLINFVNKAIASTGVKKVKRKTNTMKKITMQSFETYRTNDKKGIYKYIKKLQPKCYGKNIHPSQFIPFVSKIYFNLTQSKINEAQELSNNVVKENLFKLSIPAGTIALVCILYVMAKHDLLVNYKTSDFGDFGYKNSILTHYRILLKSKYTIKDRNTLKPLNISSIP